MTTIPKTMFGIAKGRHHAQAAKDRTGTGKTRGSRLGLVSLAQVSFLLTIMVGRGRLSKNVFDSKLTVRTNATTHVSQMSCHRYCVLAFDAYSMRLMQ